MNIVVQIYMTVCVILLLFDIAFLVVKNLRNQRFYPKMPGFEEEIRKEIEQKRETGRFSHGYQERIRKRIEKTKCLLALQSILDEKPYAREWFQDTIYAVLEKYKKKSDYEQAYYAYIISTLGYEGKVVPSSFAGEFMSFLQSKSLYTFSNTMTAVYEFGDMNLLMNAIDTVDERAGFYHKKLFVDGLLTAKVDKEKLAERLIQSYEKYSVFTKECLLEFFRFVGDIAGDFCMQVIQSDPEDQEIKYAAIRYFLKYPTDASNEMFIDILKSDQELNWVDEMLAIQGLSHCRNAEVRGLIKEKITSRNWYVRVNAASYLKNNGMDKQEIAEIIERNDRYSNETLLYQYRDEPEMSGYISGLIEKLKEDMK